MKFEKSEVKLKQADAPVDQGFILICEKCGKKLSGSDDPDQNPSRSLHKKLKEKSKDTFGKKGVRPLIASCMNICPENEITLGVIHMRGKNEFFTAAIPTSEEELELLWAQLKERFP